MLGAEKRALEREFMSYVDSPLFRHFELSSFLFSFLIQIPDQIHRPIAFSFYSPRAAKDVIDQ